MARAATTTLTAHDAIDIYLAKASCSARDGSTSVLSKRYNITMKAVRDVWNLRTWAWTTMPYWTRSDLAKFLRKHLCAQCKTNGVTSLASACKECANPRRRGRPCRTGLFSASLRSDTADPRLNRVDGCTRAAVYADFATDEAFALARSRHDRLPRHSSLRPDRAGKPRG